MPIRKLKTDHSHQERFSLGNDVELILCSKACLLSQVGEKSQIVRTGQTDETAITVILDNGRLLVPLSGAKRSSLHVLGSQNGKQTRKANWEKLIGVNHPALMNVYRICDCMAEVQILAGHPFDDAGTTPAWKKTRALYRESDCAINKSGVEFDNWRRWMASLADGLAQLEILGLAHGDPYPFNAICHGKDAAWVDFGNLTDDQEQILKDAWAFVLFTILHTHRLTKKFSKTLLNNIADSLVAENRSGRFSEIRAILLQQYDDVIPLQDARVLVFNLAQALQTKDIQGNKNPVITEILIKAASQYFTDFLHHIDRANYYSTAFHGELQRHRLLEREMLRLTVPKADHERFVQDLTLRLAERDGQIDGLKQAVAECDGQIDSLKQIVAELESARSQILQSYSWRITRPARFLLSILGHGMGGYGRAQVFMMLRNLYRRLPLPFKIKDALGKAFLRLTGWSNQIVVAQFQSASVLCSGIQSMTNQTLAGQNTNNNSIAVPVEASYKIKPYFGVRRPHGKRRAAILTNQLLDWHDGRPRFGGGERYALELARLLRELSIEVTFFQPSLRPSSSNNYYSFEVQMLPLGGSVGEFHYGVCTRFTEISADYDHVYYHMPEYASGTVREDGLMTCHGIWFDHNNYPDSIFRTLPWFEQLYSAFQSPLGVVSVDTNSISVIRSLWPEMAQKMRYIPNFYDANSYYPDSTKRNPKRLTILFPRRSQINRGSRIFGDIVDRIPHDVDIIWLGEGDLVDTQIVKDVCARDKRVSFHVADFDHMPAWYQKSDIAVIPTLACEGTSLSCIEALACGCAVIATNVGGLPDIVYDGINGLLVEPNASSIANAINRLIEDNTLRERLQRSSAEAAGNFELQMWRARWVELLRGFGWISDSTCSAWFAENHMAALVTHPTEAEKWVILTRNAIHGGVESLIREESKLLRAPVIVCGGHDRKDTCPFEYSRADDARVLEKVVADYDVILYHWLPDWALEVIRKSHKISIEFVHRTDTSESDKSVPTALVTHSAFLAKFIHETYGKLCRVVDHPIAIDQFVPQPELGPCIGAITSYYEIKGIDIFLRAWALLKHEFPNIPVRFYGAGDDLHRFIKLADELGIDVEFRETTREPWRAMQEFRCFVVPSRIEGLPVAILEALSMNIPVVASALPGMSEFNDLALRRGYEGYIYLANPEDPEDLSRVIRAVLMNGVSKDSNLYIRDYYSPQKHCSDLVSVLREVRRH